MSLQIAELDLGSIVPSLSGPKRPHDRVAVAQMKDDFRQCLLNKVLLMHVIQSHASYVVFGMRRQNFCMMGVTLATAVSKSRVAHSLNTSVEVLWPSVSQPAGSEVLSGLRSIS